MFYNVFECGSGEKRLKHQIRRTTHFSMCQARKQTYASVQGDTITDLTVSPISVSG